MKTLIKLTHTWARDGQACMGGSSPSQLLFGTRNRQPVTWQSFLSSVNTFHI